MNERLLWGALAVAAWLLPAAPAAAQPFDEDYYRRTGKEPIVVETVDRDSLGIDTLRRIDTVAGEQMRLRDGGNGRVMLEVGGYGLTLGRSYESKAWDGLKRKKVWMTLLHDFEFGFNYLSGLDYAGYAPEQQGFLDQRLGPSFHFSFHIVGLGGTFNRSRSLTYDVGLQYTVDNIRLIDNASTVGYEQGRIVPVALDVPADKSKLVYSYLGIPLRLNYRPVKRVELHLPCSTTTFCWEPTPSASIPRGNTACRVSAAISSGWGYRPPTAGSDSSCAMRRRRCSEAERDPNAVPARSVSPIRCTFNPCLS